MGPIETDAFVWRLGAAILCGLILGIDRELRNKPLGLRSYVIVCAASAAWAMTAIDFAFQMARAQPDLAADPTRVIQGLVGAIGFLGAGAILSRKQDGHLKGVASGATIWASGAVGMACGTGQIVHALIVSVALALVLNLYEFAVRRLGPANASMPRDDR
ncbi:putative Mg2+ transporter-C (MgtC) family protein [Albidovulum inexpectatum]|uniref:Protein MgtC n=1 Tax=Albidovulum inexpectatum TaxID=196587 RepID=A0A2S5JI94_9RHOB|nr:MgtC/SapB family protein [Albidovulum inexpectatum]PPB81172.1 putative Mg2+ transporter-C (MgtC) family protein [Albidovulum inexpectatum]